MKIINITKESGIPVIGNIAFGIIDRGSSLLQIRPISMCNLSCIFCSTDAGPNSKTHKTGYVIEPNYLVDEVNKVISKKGKTHINIDSVGEPASYQYLTKIITELNKNKDVTFISMQSNGTYFTKEKIDELEKAGLKRIHLSIHTTNPDQAKKIMGTENYELEKVLDIAEYISKSKIELLIAPVWLPNINDEEIENLIVFAKKLNIKIGIQKYEEYKYSRKPGKIKKDNYYKFYKKLEELEKKHNIKLVYKHEKLQIEKAKSLKKTIEIGEKINCPILAEGWFKSQRIVAHKKRNITVNNCDSSQGDRINIKVLENKNNIYLAEKV